MANFNFNKIMIGGRLTADPEARQTTSGVPMTTFSVAVNRRFSDKNSPEQQQSDFFNVISFNKTAEFVSKFFRKGSSVFIVGSAQTRNYVDKQGIKRYVTEIIAENVQFVDSKSEASEASAEAASEKYHASTADVQPRPGDAALAEFVSLANDEDLPF